MYGKELDLLIQPLHNAVLHNDIDQVRTLIDKAHLLIGEDTSKIAEQHYYLFINSQIQSRASAHAKVGTSLHVAIHKGNVGMVKLLLENGADMYNTVDDNNNPLHLIAKPVYTTLTDETKIEIAHLLLQEYSMGLQKKEKGKTPINGKNVYGQTPLHLAVSEEHYDLAKLFIENSALVNIQDKQGNTPLHLAMARGNTEIAKLLQDNGADITIQNSNGKTPADLAQQHNEQLAQDSSPVKSASNQAASSEPSHSVDSPSFDMLSEFVIKFNEMVDRIVNTIFSIPDRVGELYGSFFGGQQQKPDSNPADEVHKAESDQDQTPKF